MTCYPKGILSKPIKPFKPQPPEEFKECGPIRLDAEGFNLEEINQTIANWGIQPKEASISYDVESGHLEILFYSDKPKRNPHYDEQLKRYQEALELYPIRIKQYKRQLREWNNEYLAWLKDEEKALQESMKEEKE